MTTELHPQPAYTLWESILEDGSFEDVYEALATVVSQLEDARLSLEDSLACYDLGVRLAERCERYLDEAELRITRLDEIGSIPAVNGDVFDADDDTADY